MLDIHEGMKDVHLKLIFKVNLVIMRDPDIRLTQSFRNESMPSTISRAPHPADEKYVPFVDINSSLDLSLRIANGVCPNLNHEGYWTPAPELIQQVQYLAGLLISAEFDVIVEISEFVVTLPFVFLLLDALRRPGCFGRGVSLLARFPVIQRWEEP